jgi:hypothetical protein
VIGVIAFIIILAIIIGKYRANQPAFAPPHVPVPVPISAPVPVAPETINWRRKKVEAYDGSLEMIPSSSEIHR